MRASPNLAAWRGDVLAVLAGALLPLAFAPFHLFPLAVIAPALFWLTLEQATPRLALRRGFLFGLGLFGVGVSWVYVAIHDFGYSGVVVATVLTALFVAVLALYPALFAWLAVRLRDRADWRWYLLALPALWVAVEWLRGWLFTGFTWLQLGYSQEHSLLAGWAPVLGVYGLSLLCAFSAGALLWWMRGGRRAWPGVAVALALWLAGVGLQQVEWTAPDGAPLRVALLQDNLPQATKWDQAQFNARLQLYERLTLEQIGTVEAVIWPENALTTFFHELEADYFAPLAQQARAAGSDLVVGVPVRKREGRGYYTSMVLLGGHEGAYHKRHLVPFGEYVPLEGLLRGLIRFFDLPMSGFSPGPVGQAPLAVAGRPAAVTICYEDAFGEELLHNFPQATVLLNGSNNAWYGDSFAPHQHLEIARMRAIESGRPLLRATTNGISALVDHRGRILARSAQFEQAVLVGQVQPMAGSTPYTRWGNAPVLALLLTGLVGAWLAPRRQARGS